MSFFRGMPEPDEWEDSSNSATGRGNRQPTAVFPESKNPIPMPDWWRDVPIFTGDREKSFNFLTALECHILHRGKSLNDALKEGFVPFTMKGEALEGWLQINSPTGHQGQPMAVFPESKNPIPMPDWWWDVPIFTGDPDKAHDFLTALECHILHRGKSLEDAFKEGFVPFTMKEDALYWWVENEKSMTSWAKFVELFRRTYCESDVEVLGTLEAMRQEYEEPLHKFVSRFRKEANKYSSPDLLPESYLTHLAVARMQNWARRTLLLVPYPKTLTELSNLVRDKKMALEIALERLVLDPDDWEN